MGVATGTAYSLLGLPGALLLGLIAALTEAIPIVGPLLGAIPAVLVASTVSPELALIVAGVYIVIQLIEGSVLVPLVMRNTVGISPLLVMLSLLIGGAVGGLLGALLAVPIAASAEIVLSRLQAREKPVAQDPAAIETPDDEVREGHERSLPDAGERASVAEVGRRAGPAERATQPRAATAMPARRGRRRASPSRAATPPAARRSRGWRSASGR